MQRGAVIGPRWLTLTDAAGRHRIDDPGDWIRREITEALSHGLRVIPVLTGDAALPAEVLPTEADLPADIAGVEPPAVPAAAAPVYQT